MENTNKKLAKIKAKFAETLYNLVISIDNYIYGHTIPASLCSLERDSEEAYISDTKRFTKVYASDLKDDLDDDEESNRPVTLRQINLAFVLYSDKVAGEDDSVRDIYNLLTDLLNMCKNHRDKLDIARDIEARFEDMTKVESHRGLSSIAYDDGFDPSDIFGDVTAFRDNVVLILNELIIDEFGGQEAMIQQMKNAAEEMADEDTEESK